MNRSPFEIVTRRALEVMGNTTAVPTGEPGEGPPPNTLEAPEHEDGTTIMPFRLDEDDLDNSHYFLI